MLVMCDYIIKFEVLTKLSPYIVAKHRWFSGRIIAFQAVDPGSIPGRCIFYHNLSSLTLTTYLSNTYMKL